MLLSRTFAQGKAAGCTELPIATAAAPCLRQPQQLSSLLRFSAAPALQQAARTGHSSVMRSFATDAHDAQQLSVKEAIKSELEYEHDNHDPDADLPAQPPAPWTLTESPGDSQLLLTRQYNDETIEVRVIADECHDDSDEEHPLAGMHPNAEGEDQEAEMAQALDDSIDVAIIAEANIAKGNKSIDIGFRTDGSYVEVVDVSLGKPDVKEDDETAYAGPKYEELDDQVQTAFDAYLAERGIDAEFGEYLMKLAADKEQREYVGWLQKLHKFL
jgi:hypothetical protein